MRHRDSRTDRNLCVFERLCVCASVCLSVRTKLKTETRIVLHNNGTRYLIHQVIVLIGRLCNEIIDLLSVVFTLECSLKRATLIIVRTLARCTVAAR